MRHSLPVLAGATIVAIIAAGAILGPVAYRQDPLSINLSRVLAGPSPDHPLGFDALGRDVLARLFWGARLSLGVSTLVVALSVAIGAMVGGAAGLAGGWIDGLVMRAVDVALAFPGFLLALALAAILGPGLTDLVIALSAMGWTGYARLVRGEVLSLRERPFVEAARALGASPPALLMRHLVPNLAGPIAVRATFGIGGIIVAEAALSFLGLGARPPTPSWGNMLDEGRAFMLVAPHITVAPTIAIGMAVLGFNLLGDGLAHIVSARQSEAIVTQ